jgi:hypothetical protein
VYHNEYNNHMAQEAARPARPASRRRHGARHAAVALVVVLSVCFAANRSNAAFALRETPQRYVLAGGDTFENAFKTMPTITLYKAGTAKLSQPMISSLGLFGTGSYKVEANELTVSQEGFDVVFTISDNGDTLTIKSTSLYFTKVGAVYQYQSSADYASQYKTIKGKPLTLDTLRALAKNPQSITLADFNCYEHIVIDPDYYLLYVGDEYSVRVVFDADGNTSCSVERLSNGDTFPLTRNGSTGLVFEAFLGETTVPNYTPQKWLDMFANENLWDESREITLPEFSGVTFTWTSDKVNDGEKDLFTGMPIWNVYLADLTNDGKPEFCATVSFGSGIVDTHIVVYDYVMEKSYVLSDRMAYDYFLSLQDGRLMATQKKHSDDKSLVSSELQIVNGSLYWVR